MDLTMRSQIRSEHIVCLFRTQLHVNQITDQLAVENQNGCISAGLLILITCYCTNTPQIWDYVGDKHVHRLNQSKAEGKSVLTTGFVLRWERMPNNRLLRMPPAAWLRTILESPAKYLSHQRACRNKLKRRELV